MSISVRRKAELARIIVAGIGEPLENLINMYEPGAGAVVRLGEQESLRLYASLRPLGNGLDQATDANLVQTVSMHILDAKKPYTYEDITVLNLDNLKRAIEMRSSVKRSM